LLEGHSLTAQALRYAVRLLQQTDSPGFNAWTYFCGGQVRQRSQTAARNYTRLEIYVSKGARSNEW